MTNETIQGLKRISWLPDRDTTENGTLIAGQEYYDVEFTGGNLSNVVLTDVTINGVQTALTQTVLTAPGNYSVLPGDTEIVVSKIIPEITTITLPVGSGTRFLIFKDGAGNCSSFPITLNGNGSNIDSLPTQILNVDYESVQMIWNGTDSQWNVTGSTRESDDVVGPGVSTDNAIARFNGTSGQIIQNSGIIISDANNITGATSIVASNFVGSLIGNADTATLATASSTLTIVNDTTTNATMYPTWVTANTGNLPQKTSSTKLTFNPSTGALSATNFVGAFAGNTFTTGTGTLTIGAGKTISSTVGLTVSGADIAIVGSGTSTYTFPASSDTLVGRASTDTLTNKTLNSPVLVTPALGTPASGVLTNCTGYPISSLATLGAGVATWLTTPSSANLIAAVTDETGTGALVFANTPTFVTPLLGTPTSGNLANCTAFPVGQIAGLSANVGTWLGNATSANLIAAMTDETGTGSLVFGTTPTIATPVLNGTPTGTGVASAATVSTLVLRDANANTTLNNLLESYATTATAAGTTTLTVGSTYQQFFTGATTQTVVMPVASTLVLGQSYLIVNNSSGAVTVQSSGANTIVILAGGTWGIFTCILASGTGTASWSFSYEGMSIASGKKLTLSNTLTFTGTDASSVAFGTGGTVLYSGGALGAVSATSLTFTSTSGIIGTTTNDSAAALSVGQLVESTVLVGSAVALTTATAADVTSISLTAGDWDVWGSVWFSQAAGTTTTSYIGWISQTSATLPTSPNSGAMFIQVGLSIAGASSYGNPVGTTRISLAGTTTVYLSARSSFTVSTNTAFGYIGARRRR